MGHALYQILIEGRNNDLIETTSKTTRIATPHRLDFTRTLVSVKHPHFEGFAVSGLYAKMKSKFGPTFSAVAIICPS